jgi:tetratricopeptide (TPR) repeat protein
MLACKGRIPMRPHVSALALLALLTACRPAARPVLVEPAGRPAAGTADADRLFAAGCYECLREALARYEAAGAAAATFRTAILLEIRRREIGVLAEDYLARARAIAETLPGTVETALWIEIADHTPWNGAAVTSDVRDRSVDRLSARNAARARWSAALAPAADADPAAAYLDATVNCEPALRSRAARTDWREHLQALLARHPLSPLVSYKVGVCSDNDPVILADLLALEPRFMEAHYFLGQRELIQRAYEAAEQQLRVAAGAIDRWPAAALLLGDVLLGLEDLEAAVAQYEETLALVPGQREALLGEGRALSYLERHAEAIGALERLLETGTWYIGEAYYWRAWNRFRLRELEAARTDVDAAKQLLVSVDVFKLGGLIAFYRRDFQAAKADLTEAIRLNAQECEAMFYLGGAYAEERAWTVSGPTYTDTVACLADSRATIEAHLADLEVTADAGAPRDDRAVRLLARRRRDLVSVRRLEANAAYNAAVSYFNMGRRSDALALGERAAQHDEFQARARALIARIDARP